MGKSLIALRSHVGTLLLAVFMALGVAYYVLTYLPQREAYLRARYFRVMARIGENMLSKVQISYKRSETMMREIRYEKLKLTKDGADTEYSAVEDTLRRRWNRQGLNYPHFAKSEAFSSTTTDAAPPAIGWDSATQRLLISADFADATLPVLRVRSWLEMEEFVRGLLRPDVFEHFLILGPKSAAQAGLVFDQVYYSTFPAPAGVQDGGKGTARWWRDSTGIQVTRLVDFTIEGRPYKLFVEPVRLKGQTTWLLCGAVPAEQFRAEQWALPSGWLELTLIVILAGMLALPFLKVLLMSPRESLDSRDVYWCVASLVIGLAALMVVLLSPIVRDNVEGPLMETQLRQLADSVETKVSQELSGISQAMDTVTQELRATTDKTPIVEKKEFPAPYLPAYTKLRPNSLNLTQSPQRRPWQTGDRMLWLDSAGNVVAKVAHDSSKFLPNLSERNYFQDIVQRRGWQLEENNDTFVLASVFTFGRVGGKFPLVAQANPPTDTLKGLALDRQPKVRTYATALRSLTQPVLPPDYSFCLIDGRGEVQFHSDSLLSLSENLFADAEPPGGLRASMFARRSAAGHIQYQGRAYHFYLRPLHGWPLFVVTLANEQAGQARQMQTLTMAVLLLLGLAGVGLLLGGITVLSRPRRHSLLFFKQTFNRLWPRAEREGQYWKMLVMQAILLLTLLVAAQRTAPLTELALLLVLPIYGFGFDFHALRLSSDEHTSLLRNMKLCTVVSLLIVNFAAWYWLGNELFWWPFLACQVVPALAVGTQWTAAALRQREVPLPLLVPPAAGGTISTPPKVRQRFQYPFAAWVLGWVLLLSIAPALSCYFVAYRAEREIEVRFAHLQLKRTLTAKAQKKIFDNQKLAQFDMAFARAYYPAFLKTSYHEASPSQSTPGPPDQQITTAERNFRQLILAVHPAFDDQAETARLVLATSEDPGPGTPDVPDAPIRHTSWHVRSAPGSALQMSTTFRQPTGRLDSLTSTVPLWYWRPPAESDGAEDSWARQVTAYGKWPLVLALALFSLYALLLALTRRIFALVLLPLKLLVRHAVQHNKNCLGEEADRYQFLLCPTRTSTYRGALPDEVARLDCRTLDGTTTVTNFLTKWWQEQSRKNTRPNEALNAVALEHFEYQVRNIDITKQKIALINQLMLSGKRILIISRIPPEMFGDCGHARELCTDKDTHKPIWQAGDALVDALARFQVLIRPGRRQRPLSHSSSWPEWPEEESQPEATHPHLPQKTIAEDEHEKTRKAELLKKKTAFEDKLELAKKEYHKGPTDPFYQHYLALRWFLQVECDALPFLRSLEADLEQLLLDGYERRRRLTEDEIVLSIQQRAQFQFHRLWEMLTPPEHFLLYDLARDGLVNASDTILIDTLLQKGLLVYDTKLRLVSESFRNYLLTGLTRAQAVRIEEETAQEARMSGAWASRSLPLFVLLSAAACFIFVTQRSALNETQAFLAAIGAIVPLLARFIGYSSFTNLGQPPS
ncbi:cache domain-containing protein [Hymenobacter sp. HD11105]